MKKFVLAVIVMAVAAAGVYFGVPAFAEYQFRAALDAHVAARGTGNAEYSGARLDYWNDRAWIDSFSDVLVADFAGRPRSVRVTLSSVAIEKYDLAALEAALVSGVGAQRIADRVSWSSVEMRGLETDVRARGGAGAIEALSLAGIDPVNPYSVMDLRFVRLSQEPLTVEARIGEFAATGDIGAVAIAGFVNGGFEEASLGAVSIVAGSAAEAGAFDLKLASESLEISGLRRGEPITIAGVVHKGLHIDFDAAAGETPVRGSFSYGVHDFENARLDERSLELYGVIARLAQAADGGLPPQELAPIMESFLSALERAVSLETGAERFSARDIRMEVEGLQIQEIDSIEGGPVRGLSIASIETLGQRQSDALGTRTEVRRSLATGIDLSSVPAYLRQVFGTPVTASSLEAAGAFFQQRPLVEVIPAFDLGVWVLEDEMIISPQAGTFHIGRMSLDRMRSDGNGKMELGFSAGGMALDIATIPVASPQAEAFVAAFRAEGLDELVFDFGFGVSADLAAGAVDVDELRLSSQGLASTSLRVSFRGLDFEGMSGMTAESRQEALMMTPLHFAGIELADAGLRTILLKTISGQSGATPEQMAHVLSLQVEQIAAGMESARAVEIGRSVGAFLMNGGGLRLAAEPVPPVPVIQLMIDAQVGGPAQVLERLNLTAGHLPGR